MVILRLKTAEDVYMSYTEKHHLSAFKKNHYYSVNFNDTWEAITDLAQQGSVDASRELIQIFSNSLWRETKIHILKALGSFSNDRALEFLFEVAGNDQDLALAEVAIAALGKINSRLSSHFLLQLFKFGNESLKPTIVMALAEQGYNLACSDFLEELKNAIEDHNILLSKNLIYALGELKYQKATTFIKNLFQQKLAKDLQLSSLVCLGKISRDMNDFNSLEEHFKNDSFEHEIFKQAKNQSQFRSQWSLEDYLIKLFESESHHKNLAFELNAFAPADVKVGLEMFNTLENFDKMCTVLSKLNFDQIGLWYKDLFSKFQLNEAQFHTLADSITYHKLDNDDAIKWLQHLDENLLLKINSLSVTKAEQFLKTFFTSNERYPSLSESEKIICINTVAEYALAHLPNAKTLQSLTQLLEVTLPEEKNANIKGRWIRLSAQAHLHSNKLHQIFKGFAAQKEHIDSLLYYAEKNPQYHNYLLLKEILKKEGATNFSNNSGNNSAYNGLNAASSRALIKALSAQPKNQVEWNDVSTFITNYAKGASEVEDYIVLLKFIQVHFPNDLKIFAMNGLNHKSEEIQLHSVVALKNYDTEDISQLIQPFLQSHNASLLGRSLDTLCHHQSLKAKRICFDFMIQNISNTAVVEKVCRHLTKSQLKSDYFLKALDKVIADYPKHDFSEELNELRSKIYTDIHEGGAQKQPSEADIIAIDKILNQQLTGFNKMDDAIKVSLRSAEIHFIKPDLYNEFVDVSACVLGYAKAIDIFLEKTLGKKLLYPRLENRLSDFQNVIHVTGLNTDHPIAEKILKWFSLDKQFTPQSLPLHKMTLMGKGMMNTKILHESHKIIDGLRAWSIILLLFCRTTYVTPKPLINLNLDESTTLQLSKKLVWLQELRNPIAHRQTLTKMNDLISIRKEIFEILVLLEKAFI